MSPNLQAWMAVLAKMEADVAAITARQGPSTDSTPTQWTPPKGVGPIPPELVLRARDLEFAQQAAVERLEAAKATTASHLAAIQSVFDARSSGRSVFLDVTG